jgi:hypothetical protein
MALVRNPEGFLQNYASRLSIVECWISVSVPPNIRPRLTYGRIGSRFAAYQLGYVLAQGASFSEVQRSKNKSNGPCTAT